MQFFALFLHIIIDYLLGVGILSFFDKKERNTFERLAVNTLVGFLFETLFCFIILVSGGSIYLAANMLLILVAVVNIKNVLNIFKDPRQLLTPWKESFSFLLKFAWYDWILLLLVMEKFYFVLSCLNGMPTYFSDSLKTWSAQGKSIFGEVNFSMDTNSLEFLTRKLQLVIEYPLQLPIWRAVQGILNGEWNEVVSRADGFVFLLLITLIIGGAFWRLFEKKWIALTAILIVLSIPLQVWHATSGYADIAVEAYVLAAIAAFIRKEWFLCGLFMAGAVFSKDDGLAIFLPGVLLAIITYHLFFTRNTVTERLKSFVRFGIGFTFALPWIIFQALFTNSVFSRVFKPIKALFSEVHHSDTYQVLLVQNAQKATPKPSSISLIWDYVFLGSTHGIFWWLIVIGLVIGFKYLIKDALGKSLLFFFFITISLIFYVFTFTNAYEYLLIQTTFHRTVLQFSSSALLVVGFGLSLMNTKT